VNKDELRKKIESNLQQAGIQAEEIRVQPDPFSGWRVVIVSNGFEGMERERRNSVALEGIALEGLQWTELLTKSEADWAGSLLSDSDSGQLPLWVDAFSRARVSEGALPLVFPSDLESDLPTPIIVTFYSVRGGVGRSTALAHTAQILAERGHRVICVDLDLEAPGLASLFGVESQLSEGLGVVPLLVRLDRGEQPDFTEHLLRVDEKDELYCVPAGLPSAEYARLLRQVAPSAWYAEDRNPLKSLIAGLSDSLPFRPDVILLDSRTGISEISAPLLFDLADLAVIVFFPHPQAQRATGEVVRALLASTTRRTIDNKKLTPEPRFIVSPIPSSRLPEVVNRYRVRSSEWISSWFSSADDLESRKDLADSIHFIPYREEIATADTVSRASEASRDFEAVADWVEQLLPGSEEESRPLIQESKSAILSDLHFSGGTAEHQNDFLDTFVEAGAAAKALGTGTPLVLGRKGVGKTAVFRRLLDRQDIPSIPITAPAPLIGGRPWILTPDAFAEVDLMLNQKELIWRQFWMVMACVACHYSEVNKQSLPEPPEVLREILPAALSGTSATVQLLDRLLSVTRISLVASDWLKSLDSAAKGPFFLLFDALDTGFGNSAKERERRRSAIEGLCSILIQQADLKHLKFKIVLREDIWRQLRIENKSHLYGRYVTLDWRDQTTYYKVALKQALRSPRFAEMLRAAPTSVSSNNVDDWSESEVVIAWNLLVGERMKGEKTAFTRNWVWNRLADSNADHSPRYLLQLFREVTEWEKDEQNRSSYDRSIIRPRAFIQQLPRVSVQALEALNEEYPELESLLARLRQIGRTPVVSGELENFEEPLTLAREVGLIGVYEGTEDKVERYRVPEIYRYALNMTRKGQA
jgi:MinD-like ATPase involved in chromosome partitioning or flagellar assembly